jgi:hypothetical protein
MARRFRGLDSTPKTSGDESISLTVALLAVFVCPSCWTCLLQLKRVCFFDIDFSKFGG